ncbi:hypothetical protein FBU31_007239, partial [Coemansia sp. 'formosensis']
TRGIPCAHIIRKLLDEGKVLEVSDFNAQWNVEPVEQSTVDVETVDTALFCQIELLVAVAKSASVVEKIHYTAVIKNMLDKPVPPPQNPVNQTAFTRSDNQYRPSSKKRGGSTTCSPMN